jgi:hypothetical protein
MPSGRPPTDAAGVPPELSLWQRLLLALPRLGRNADKGPVTERLRQAMVKPVEPGAAAKAKADDVPMTIEELEDAIARTDDKERLVGLLAAPLAAIVAILVIANLIADDPAARFKDGALNPKHVSLGLYHELAVVLVVLAVLILVMAWLRKRLFEGIAMALFGLAIFDLHGWGFGIPFLLGGAWFLVRAYRLQRELKEATGEGPSRPGDRGRGASNTARPRPNKRYTPPTSPPKKSPPKPENEQRAG